MKNQKIFLILLLILMFFTTACGKINENKKVEVKKTKAKEEEKINVSGTYFIHTEDTNSPAYNEYLTLNEDKSFDRQANYCAGIKHIKGTYKVKQQNDKILIDLKPSDYEDGTIQVEYEDNKILLDKEKYTNFIENNEAILYFTRSCNNFNSTMIFYKGDSSQINYIESVYSDAYIGPNE